MRRRALVVAVLTALAACREPEPDRGAALRQQLAEMRGAIVRYRADHGRYPESLEALVPTYLRAIPVDPITGRADTWRLTTEETVSPNTDFMESSPSAARPVITDVHSGAAAPWSGY